MLNATSYKGISAWPRILLCGDTGVSVEFGDTIDPDVNGAVRRLYRNFKSAGHPGVLDVIPAYCTLFIQYDPWRCSLERLIQLIEEGLVESTGSGMERREVVEIPVCYDEELGPDLREVADFHSISLEELVRRHTAPVYSVYMIGFILGFPYLGGLDATIHTPRKRMPRKVVPAGSVGIADRQTGVYPVQSPGGWQIIGRTPARIFDLEREPPFLLEMGDQVRFLSITRGEFESYKDH
ncbi:MAG: 5-oxoprolinase subunit PxpB [Desulfobacteraceae bacterium]|nr:5-oxoprolinase subunit PxpB [Desulfobacteraceae bacterium]